MHNYLTSEQITAIDSIRTAAKIFAETLAKHAPNGYSKDRLNEIVRDALADLLAPWEREKECAPEEVRIYNEVNQP